MTTNVDMKFNFAAPPARVWRALTDPAVVASCLPGGELLAVQDDRSFRGALEVSLGPFSVRFEGDARFEVLDEPNGHAVLRVEAVESRRRAEGTMRMRSRVAAENGGTSVDVHQRLALTGPLGRFVPPGLLAEAARHALTRFESGLHRALADGLAG